MAQTMIGAAASHLEPLIRALIAGGNALAWEEGYNHTFKINQGGIYCTLAKPIDFTIARQIPMIPQVTLREDLDAISCSHCWALVYGGRHNTLMSKRR